MAIDQSIFKAYDIRGVYPTQIDKNVIYKISKAFSVFLGRDLGKKTEELSILVGRDMRISSPELHGAFIDGLLSMGVKVFDAGLIAIDQMYFALGSYPYDGGVEITASHNPKEYNGIKMYKRGAQMISAEEIQGVGKLAHEAMEGVVRGSVEPVKFDNEYADKILSFVDISNIRSLRIVLDAGNGMAGRTFPLVLRRVPQLTHIDLYFELDGTFPNHEANPEKLENTREIQGRVVREAADFGAAFDGDADRIALIDEKGTVLRGDIVTGILARHFLQKNGPGPIVYNVLCTRAVKDMIERSGGAPVEWKTGHTHMKAKMRDVGAVFGGELSGHLFFKDFYYAESSPLAFLLIAQIVSESGKRLSELAKEFMTYANWARYVYLDYDASLAVERVRAEYERLADRIDTIDGFTFYFGWEGVPIRFRQDAGMPWWFNIRSSNTEPRIHLMVESKDPEWTKQKRDEILKITGGKVAGDA